jgi:hypothetical protein
MEMTEGDSKFGVEQELGLGMTKRVLPLMDIGVMEEEDEEEEEERMEEDEVDVGMK